MSERTSSKPGIADYVVVRRKRKECFLDEIDRLIDWNPLEKILRKTLKRVVNAVGNPAYSVLTFINQYRISIHQDRLHAVACNVYKDHFVWSSFPI